MISSYAPTQNPFIPRTGKYFSDAFNQDFVNIVNELAGEKVKTFLEAWLYDDHVPDFPEMGLYAKDFALGANFK